MKLNKKQAKELLRRYFEAETSDAEERQLRAFLVSDEARGGLGSFGSGGGFVGNRLDGFPGAERMRGVCVWREGDECGNRHGAHAGIVAGNGASRAGGCGHAAGRYVEYIRQ